VAAHADYLLRNCWKAQLTISTAALRPCAGEFQPLTHMTDRELAQLVCALRLMFPDVGIVLSTREPAKLRDGLIPLGVTMLSAGSHTEPGGYTGAGKENLHQTVRGRIVELASGASEWAPQPKPGDERDGTIQHCRRTFVAGSGGMIRKLGYEPVWKDWDAALTA
jgi:2-iminoacetate synthase